jgi:predicted DNA-binding protein
MESKADTHKKRSLSLSHKTNDDLEMLCEHLGVNTHSYIVNAIAKAVQQDLMTFTSRSALNQMVEEMKKISI